MNAFFLERFQVTTKVPLKSATVTKVRLVNVTNKVPLKSITVTKVRSVNKFHQCQR